jgi:hypothetical protein
MLADDPGNAGEGGSSLSADAVRRIEEGARRGREAIRAEFASALTRKRYCELVGIHKTTLKRWEASGIVKPTRVSIRGIETWVFDEADVEAGREIARLLRDNPGQLSLQQAAVRVRRRKPDPAPSRRRSPRRGRS